MDNPWTGKPFECSVKDDVATLSDSHNQPPLTYAIRIRK
jgi:hypothetical protein